MKPVLICTLLSIFWSSLIFGAQPTAYKLDVELFPNSGEVRVAGRVTVRLEDTAQSDLVFDLHETFSISALAVNDAPAEFDIVEPLSSQFTSVVKKVRISLPPGHADQQVELSISYAGKLPDFPEYGTPNAGEVYLDDEITPQRVELSLYSSWYPSFGFGANFNSELNVSSLPDNWTIACIGQEQEKSKAGVRCLGRGVNDLVIVASPDFKMKTVETPAGKLMVYHTELPESYVIRESHNTGQTLAFFTETIGASPSTYQVLKHVYSPRKLGQGGYARVGLTVFSEGRVLDQLAQDPLASNLKGSAHESAHFWWNFGTGQGDWLNEAFAEYFSLLTVREINGDEAFDTELAQCLKAVMALPDDAPAISLVPFSNDGNGYTIRYLKGALMLDHFRQILGDDAFYLNSRNFYQKYKYDRIGTVEFREFWKRALGEEQRWVDTWLNSSGRLPAGSTPSL